MAAFFLGFHSGGRAVFTGAPFKPCQQVGPTISNFPSNFDERKMIPSGRSPHAQCAGRYVQNGGGGLVVAQVADVGRDDFGWQDMRSSKPRMVAVWSAFCGYGGSVDNSTGYMRIALC